MEKPEYKNQWCKYAFTQEEMREIAERLAIKTQEIEQVESDKKAVMSSYKEQIERMQAEVKSAARQYKDGYEMRNIECLVERDYDEGVVRYIRTDTCETVNARKMTAEERQLPLDANPTDAKAVAQELMDNALEELKRGKIERTMAQETSALG